jgi:hypothetical protein
MEDIWGLILTNYIKFYKKEISHENTKLNITDLFKDIDYEDFGSTNEIMELFHSELEKFKILDDDFRNFESIFNNIHKKYTLRKNKENLYTSNSLLSLLIEQVNLESEDIRCEFDYEIVLKENIRCTSIINKT